MPFLRGRGSRYSAALRIQRAYRSYRSRRGPVRFFRRRPALPAVPGAPRARSSFGRYPTMSPFQTVRAAGAVRRLHQGEFPAYDQWPNPSPSLNWNIDATSREIWTPIEAARLSVLDVTALIPQGVGYSSRSQLIRLRSLQLRHNIYFGVVPPTGPTGFDDDDDVRARFALDPRAAQSATARVGSADSAVSDSLVDAACGDHSYGPLADAAAGTSQPCAFRLLLIQDFDWGGRVPPTQDDIHRWLNFTTAATAFDSNYKLPDQPPNSGVRYKILFDKIYQHVLVSPQQGFIFYLPTMSMALDVSSSYTPDSISPAKGAVFLVCLSPPDLAAGRTAFGYYGRLRMSWVDIE